MRSEQKKQVLNIQLKVVKNPSNQVPLIGHIDNVVKRLASIQKELQKYIFLDQTKLHQV